MAVLAQYCLRDNKKVHKQSICRGISDYFRCSTKMKFEYLMGYKTNISCPLQPSAIWVNKSWHFNFLGKNLSKWVSVQWYISIHHVKYLDKPIICLEMRAKIKSVRKINEILLCFFTYIWKSDILPRTSIMTKNLFLSKLRYVGKMSNFQI